MLVLTRKAGEGLRIQLAPGVPETLTVAELFAAGPIEIVVTQIHGSYVRLGIRADRRLIILRDELCEAADVRLGGLRGG